MSWKYKLFVAVVSIILMMSMYQLTGWILVGTVPFSLLTDIDKLIPFVPEFVWVYISYSVLMIQSFFVTEDKDMFIRMTVSLIFAAAIACAIFLLLPVAYPRPDLIVTNLSTWVLSIVYSTDTPMNAFPSLHVALSWIVAMYHRKANTKWGMVYGWWAFAITMSVLFVKQHFFADAMLGYLLAQFSRKTVDSVFKFLKTK